VFTPCSVVLPVHSANCPLVGVPVGFRVPEPVGVPQIALPFAATPVANCDPEQVVGVAAREFAEFAVPVVLAALFGMSPDKRAGSCACGSVPVVMSDALTTTLLESAWPLTVVDVKARLLKSVVRFVT
jgi:hypothetical protein